MSENSKAITILDGIAIILIVVYHSIQMFNSNEAVFLKSTLRISEMGLFLFTFVSGYKLMLNHNKELRDKIFLKRYFVKRFIRLYKPYIGYSVLIFVPEILLIYFASEYSKLIFIGTDSFLSFLSVRGFINLLLGVNFIALQLWYLFALIVITSICFLILYWTNIKCLYCFSLLIYLYNLINPSQNYIDLKDLTVLYFPTFIFGMFWAQFKKRADAGKIAVILSALFILFIIQIINESQILHQYYIIAYGSILPCLMELISPFLLKIKHINDILYFCGKYSFQIYLFHLPIILPFLGRHIVDVFNMNWSLTPFILSIIAIIISVYAYKLCEKIKLNILFE